MCTPPFCEPARHVFGCLTLRTGAAGVLVLNLIYGLTLIVLHAMLLGLSSGEATTPAPAAPAPTAAPSSSSRRLTAAAAPAPSGYDSWLLSLLDMELAWAHRLLGMDDHTCITLGLLYGIAVFGLAAGALYLILTHATQAHRIARWYVAWLHVQIIAYVGVVLAKLPSLCEMQEEYWPHLYMDCDVLRFLYLERVFIRVFLASVCTWIFASFSYHLSDSNPVVDQVEAHPGQQPQQKPYSMMSGRGVHHGGYHPAVGQPVRTGYPTQGSMAAGQHYSFPRASTSLASSASAGSALAIRR
mmetsp:Transcript_17800/g.41497  ORF Transcript_17800/g.41497 Transcript_17800/m.41497 type:complete len:299 (+) Transcript_17800:167-1063(+)